MPDFDDALADRLLDGDIPEDLDAALAPVARLLAAAREIPCDPVEPDASLVAALQAAVARDVVDVTARRRRRTVVRTLIVAGIVGVGATSAAAAATGSLPGPAQDVAHRLGEVVGMDLPERDAPPTTGGSQDGDGHGRSDEAPGRPEEPGQPDDPDRSDEAPGQPDEVPTGVGQDGTPPGEGGTIPGTGEITPDPAGDPAVVPPPEGGTIPSTSVPEGAGQGEPPPDPGEGSGREGSGQGGGAGAGQGGGSATTNPNASGLDR